MVGIIDYGVGNLFSLSSSFRKLGQEVFVSGDCDVLAKADRLVLPGVGAFDDAIEKLQSTGLAEFIKEQAALGKPILGICLGMQLLFEKSYEYGTHTGLGLLKGEIVPMADYLPKGLKVPHMGWNQLEFIQNSRLFANIHEGDSVYFVHSYFARGDGVTAVADYGIPITASVEKDNVFGCQFHPEISGTVGLKILEAFCEI